MQVRHGVNRVSGQAGERARGRFAQSHLPLAPRGEPPVTDRQVAVQTGCKRGGGGERGGRRAAGEGAPRELREPGDAEGKERVWREACWRDRRARN